MFTREFVVDEDGLHSAIATALMRIAKTSSDPIYISRLSGQAVSVANPLFVLGMKIKANETVILVVNTPDAAAAERVFEQANTAFQLRSPR